MTTHAVTVREWMAARAVGVPAALAARMSAALSGAMDERAIPDALVAAAERQLTDAFRASPMTRAQALDVLGADALLTFAFEAAADDPDRLAERADAAMQRVAALVPGLQ